MPENTSSASPVTTCKPSQPAPVTRPAATKSVRMTSLACGPKGAREIGSVHELPAAEADAMVKAGAAVHVNPLHKPLSNAGTNSTTR